MSVKQLLPASSVADFIFAATMRHPMGAANAVEMLPVKWLRKFANPQASATAQLADKSDASLDKMWDEITAVGMTDPFMLAVGRYLYPGREKREFRMTAGNRRFLGNYMNDLGITHVPTAVIIADDCKLPGTNGNQRSIRRLLIPDEENGYPIQKFDRHEWKRPSEIFAVVAEMKNRGLLPPTPAPLIGPMLAPAPFKPL